MSSMYHMNVLAQFFLVKTCLVWRIFNFNKSDWQHFVFVQRTLKMTGLRIYLFCFLSDLLWARCDRYVSVENPIYRIMISKEKCTFLPFIAEHTCPTLTKRCFPTQLILAKREIWGHPVLFSGSLKKKHNKNTLVCCTFIKTKWWLISVLSMYQLWQFWRKTKRVPTEGIHQLFGTAMEDLFLENISALIFSGFIVIDLCVLSLSTEKLFSPSRMCVYLCYKHKPLLVTRVPAVVKGIFPASDQWMFERLCPRSKRKFLWPACYQNHFWIKNYQKKNRKEQVPPPPLLLHKTPSMTVRRPWIPQWPCNNVITP